MSLDALLDAVEAEAPAAAPTPPADAPAETAAPSDPSTPADAPEGQPEPPPAAAPAAAEVDLYSDAALSTKAGIEAARNDMRAKQRELDRARADFAIAQKGRQRKLVERETALKKERQHLRNESEIYRKAVAQLRTGTTDEVLNALGVMTGRDGLKVYEEITLAIAGKTPAKQPSPELEELRREIQALKQTKAAESENAFIERRTNELLQLAAKSPRAKLLIDRSPKLVSSELLRIKKEAFEAGQPLSDAQAVANLEATFADIISPAAGGEAPVARSSEKPRQKSTTLTAAQVAASASARPMTEDEIIEAAANDNEFLTALGLH